MLVTEALPDDEHVGLLAPEGNKDWEKPDRLLEWADVTKDAELQETQTWLETLNGPDMKGVRSRKKKFCLADLLQAGDAK